MKLLFVALTKHQYRYFSNLKRHLHADAKIVFLPSIRLSFRGFVEGLSIDFKEIETHKQREVDIKYQKPLKNWLYKKFLKLQIPLVYSAVFRAVQAYEPDFTVFWNDAKFHQAIGITAVKNLGKQTLFFENGFLPHTTQMDFQGVNAANSVPGDLAFYKRLSFDKACALPKRLQVRQSKKQTHKHADTLPEKYIFVPFQVAYDTQIVQYSPWVKDMYQLFEIIKTCAAHTGLHFVIKEHPSDRVSNYQALYGSSDKVSFSSDETQKLIENAEAVLTINSTVGIEALLFEKRVIVLGEAFYAIEGIVKTAGSVDEVIGILQNLDNWKADGETIEKFLKYLQCDYLLPDHWKNPTQRHYDTIDHRLSESTRPLRQKGSG